MAYAELAGVRVGDCYRTKVMGIINVSPESFYKGSIRVTPRDIAELAASMVKEGADVIDVGGMSTAPYLHMEVSVEDEVKRVVEAVKVVKGSVKIVVSVDTVRSQVAEASIRAGAEIVNDVSGLKYDERMVEVVSKNGASLIVMAHERAKRRGGPPIRIKRTLMESLSLATRGGIRLDRVVVDPGIGFFRAEGGGLGFSPMMGWPWYVWDCMVLRDLGRLKALGRPICVSVSRKSFIGKILGRERPEERLAGSLSASAVAVLNGAHMVRTHDVAPTMDVVRMAGAIRDGGKLVLKDVD